MKNQLLGQVLALSTNPSAPKSRGGSHGSPHGEVIRTYSRLIPLIPALYASCLSLRVSARILVSRLASCSRRCLGGSLGSERTEHLENVLGEQQRIDDSVETAVRREARGFRLRREVS